MPVSRTEICLLAAITITGFAVRFAFLDELAVEHFDEGVYASNLWFPDEGYQYPDRFLYAPPLVPGLIEWSMIIFGPTRWAPFLPSLMLGGLTVPLAWWSVRRWASGPAGIAASGLIALNDFHIAMSRSALTDAPMLFFLMLAVWLTIEALADRNLRRAVLAGIATGLAWATKYNGWLPMAIAISGAAGAWMFWPRNRTDRKSDSTHLPVRPIVVCLAVLSLTAALVWLPVWWDLQPVGGYSRVAQNHQNYITGPAGWWKALIRHEAVQRHYAGGLTMLSGWLAVVSAALVLRVERSTWNGNHAHRDDAATDSTSGVKRETKRSTWNEPDRGAEPLESSASRTVSGVKETTRDRSTWNGSGFIFKVVVAGALAGAVVLSPLIALAVWAITELVATVVTLRQIQQRSHASVTGAAKPRRSSRRRSSQSVDENESQFLERQQRAWFGSWLHLAWFCGLLLATPLYRPYPRLILPLIGVASLATGLAIVRLLRGRLVSGYSSPIASGIGVDTGTATDQNEAGLEPRQVTDEPDHSSVAEAADVPQRRKLRPWRFLWLAPVVALCVWRAAVYPSGAWQNRSGLAQIADEVVATAARDSAGDPRPTEDIDFVMYVYGEPGLLFHLPRDGVPVQPVMDLSFAMPGSDHPRIPTYVLAGPHAWKNPQFGDQYRSLPDNSLVEVAEFPYRASDFVLLDDHAPRLLGKNRHDVVKLFRVQFR